MTKTENAAALRAALIEIQQLSYQTPVSWDDLMQAISRSCVLTHPPTLPVPSMELLREARKALEPFVRSLESLNGERPLRISSDDVASAYDLTESEIKAAETAYNDLTAALAKLEQGGAGDAE